MTIIPTPLIYTLIVFTLSFPSFGNELEAQFQSALVQNPIMRCLNAIRETLGSEYGDQAAKDMIENVGRRVDVSDERRCHESTWGNSKQFCLERAYRAQIRFLINELGLERLRSQASCRGF